MGYAVDSVTLMGRIHKQISVERKGRLKPLLNKDIRTLENFTFKISFSKYSAGKHERS